MVTSPPEAADIVIEYLRALPLLHEVLRQQLQFHDHVGQPGGDLLLEEVEGALGVTECWSDSTSVSVLTR